MINLEISTCLLPTELVTSIYLFLSDFEAYGDTDMEETAAQLRAELHSVLSNYKAI